MALNPAELARDKSIRTSLLSSRTYVSPSTRLPYHTNSVNLLATVMLRLLLATVVSTSLFADSDALSMTTPASARRAFLQRVSTVSAAAATGLLGVPTPSLAVTGAKKCNAKLAGYGLPPVPQIDGLTPLVEIYGKGANRFPLLVTFSYPFDWVVSVPNNNDNGEDGTIQAGEYAKGDSATLFVNPSLGNVKVSAEKRNKFPVAIIFSHLCCFVT